MVELGPFNRWPLQMEPEIRFGIQHMGVNKLGSITCIMTMCAEAGFVRNFSNHLWHNDLVSVR